MLRRGALRTEYGEEACDGLIAVAEGMPAAAEASPDWLDKLVDIPDIDPGEAQIFAAAVEPDAIVISGDKRAVRALSDVRDFVEALDGRVVVVEALLISLCVDLGVEEMRRRLEALAGLDTMVRVCFSPDNADPQSALLSYYQQLEAEVASLRLWNPTAMGKL